MKSQTRADLAMTVAIAALGGALVFSGFSLLRLHWGGRSMATQLELPELLGIAGAGIGIALLCWWLFALACAFLSALASRHGAYRLSSATAGWSPAFMRRVVATVVGINLLGAPLASAAEAPGVDPLWHGGIVATSPASVPGNSGGSATGSILPTPSPTATSAPVDPQWVPQRPDVEPDLLIRQPPREPAVNVGNDATEAAASADIEGGDVVVKKGDTLWGIVSDALGPLSNDVDVAMAWPKWYATNRDTIGADPNVILPGQILHAPHSY